ncbi:MAG: helix-turn-helix domain-containing protein [Bacteroidales bacterium]|nr:helix-turn-helix domain-containing protein [Bacteroidales bacterium]
MIRMLTQYTIYDIINSQVNKRPYFYGIFEDTEDPDIEWPHRHDYYSLIHFTQGNGLNVIDFKEYEIIPNRMFLMNPGQIHNWSYSSNTKGYILLVDKFFFQFENYNMPFVDVSDEFRSMIHSFWNFQIQQCQKKDEITEKSAQNGMAFFNDVITRIIAENNYKPPQIPSEIENLMVLISENLSGNLLVNDYADLLHIPVDKLNDMCKSSMGLTTKQLIIEQQITEAKRLLFFTTLSVKEIAYKLGFEDSSYFSRLFKNKTNNTPNAFREKVPEKQKKVL